MRFDELNYIRTNIFESTLAFLRRDLISIKVIEKKLIIGKLFKDSIV